MSPHPPIPSAAIARPRWYRRLARWGDRRLQPPERLRTKTEFSAMCSWSLTGALAACVGLSLYALLVTGLLWTADMTLTVGWALGAMLGVLVLVWPFLLSYILFGAATMLVGGRRRAIGAVYGAAFHVAAHVGVMTWLDSEPWSLGLAVPVLIGGVWGSWLPAALAPRSA